MSDRSSRPVSTLIRVSAAIAAATGLLLSPLSVAASWTRFHGDAANSGFIEVVTAPAGKGSLSVPGLGTFAPGAGPVIAPDGTVYLGTEQGKLIALQADGRQVWSRELGQAFGLNLRVVASPAVGADGSIYVIGVLTFRDHKAGEPPVTRNISELYKFTPGGGLLWRARLPAGELGRGGNASAPPNIWQSSGTEVVMVPAVFALGVSRLFAFSTDGVILADTVVSRDTSESVASSDFPALGFDAPETVFPSDPADRLPKRIGRPRPGPAVELFASPPVVIVSDGVHDVVGYSFFPGRRFIEVFRAHDAARFMRSSPTLLLDGHSAVGTGGAIVFAGPNPNKLRPVTKTDAIFGAPTRLADGRFVVVENRDADRTSGSAVTVLRRVHDRVSVLSRTPLPGQSIAAAAASRSHVFVSTASGFHSFDAETMTEVSRVNWLGGGVSPPAIGPAGHVYAIASNILFIFPPPGGFGP
jgi:outer membrane protein assembly factor BamB